MKKVYYFKSNKSYFDFINKYKDKYKDKYEFSVSILPKSIRVELRPLS